MRTILFRAKSIETKEWIFGDLAHDGKNPCISNAYIDIFYGVIPETVGEFTGLTDKNGTNIFEGDIIAHFDLENKKQIIFKNGAFGYMTADGYDFISYSENRHNFDFRDNKSDFIEVVGNIHDNPELLEGFSF